MTLPVSLRTFGFDNQLFHGKGKQLAPEPSITNEALPGFLWVRGQNKRWRSNLRPRRNPVGVGWFFRRTRTPG